LVWKIIREEVFAISSSSLTPSGRDAKKLLCWRKRFRCETIGTIESPDKEFKEEIDSNIECALSKNKCSLMAS
jgi:hypothetical protein